MNARAALAALAILAGSLVTPLAAAEPPPPLAGPPQAESAPPSAPAPPVDAPPVAAPPVYSPPSYAPPGYAPPGYAPPGYAPPGYVPPGYEWPFVYAPWPIVWHAGEVRSEASSREPPPRLPSRDPMLTAGIALGVAGILTTALGAGLFVSAGSSQTTCGLSGCIELPDRRDRSAAAAVIAGGIGGALFGGAVAIGGARGPVPARRSNAAMVTGLVFTALGVGAAAGSVMQKAMFPGRDPRPGEAFPPGTSREAALHSTTPIALALTAGTCFAVGIPLWLTGARRRSKDARAAASALDLLPSAGGAALRWTR